MTSGMHWLFTPATYSNLYRVEEQPRDQFEEILRSMIIMFKIPQNWVVT